MWRSVVTFRSRKSPANETFLKSSVLDIHFPRHTQVKVPWGNTRPSSVKCHDSKAQRYVCRRSTVQSTAQMLSDDRGTHIQRIFLFNNQPDALIIQIYSVIKLYMFRASSLPIIRSFLLYIRHCNAIPSWLCLQAVIQPAWNLPMPNVQ